MTVRVRLFAVLREAAGSDSVELELPEGATVATALAALSSQPPLAGVLVRLPVRMAVNRSYADAEARLAAGDELALVPPVSGGAGPHVRVVAGPLSRADVATAVADSRAGAIVTFEGVTRAVERLEYEAYGEMAEARIAAILGECAQRHRLLGVAAEHRTGTVPLGEPAVIVAASAAHRAEAFAGASEAIDRIKAEAPVWKREVERDGTASWAEGRLPHLGEDGPRMVDIGAKPLSERMARARARLRMSTETAQIVVDDGSPKGDVLTVARLAGVQAAKQTAALIPLAHPLPLSFAGVSASVDAESGLVELVAEARTVARTGVEMEALTACVAAALTVYDMVKGIERGVTIEQVALLEKGGGRSSWQLDEGERS